MMKSILWISFLITSVVLCRPSCAQSDIEATDKKIFQEIHEHSEVMKNLEYLSDVLGPRLTGSDQLREAVNWASKLSDQYGLDNVHVEGWTIAHSWRRGVAQARIVSPVSRNLMLASAAWSPSTPGRIGGKIVYISANNMDKLREYKGQLKDLIVIMQPPADLSWELGTQPFTFQDQMIQEPTPTPDSAALSRDEEFYLSAMAFLKNEGVAAILRDSDKTYGLLNMVNVGGKYEIGAIPTAVLTHEDYSLIWRLLQKGPVQMELSLSNSFSEGPVEVHNIVAEIRGVERPDEVVIICAHLDSWDLGSGATDDGAGVVALLEAGRALRALGLRPRRTIRLILFVGEEQGQKGSQEYVKQHESELNKISAVLEDDTSTGGIVTIRLNQHYAARKAIDTVLAPMTALQLREPRMERFYGSDYATFNEVGVPGFSCYGGLSAYLFIHHSQADTFEKIHEEGVVQAAQVLAGWAYNTSQLPALLPRE